MRIPRLTRSRRGWGLTTRTTLTYSFKVAKPLYMNIWAGLQNPKYKAQSDLLGGRGVSLVVDSDLHNPQSHWVPAGKAVG